MPAPMIVAQAIVAKKREKEAAKETHGSCYPMFKKYNECLKGGEKCASQAEALAVCHKNLTNGSKLR